MADHGKHKNRRVRGVGRHRQRQQILELVREYDEAVDAAELALQTGLHTTTVRFHLDVLCSEGVVERTRITRSGVGRPRTGYLAVSERLDYRNLAELLALELGDTVDIRRRRAEAAGQRWARQIARPLAREDIVGQHILNDAGPLTILREQAELVATVFDRMGFGAELVPDAMSTTGSQQTVRLHDCPIRDLARAYPEVGCALHHGLLQSLLATPAVNKRSSTARRPVVQAQLEPFVEPELCLVRVTAHD